MNRVVITGLGCLTPIGNTAETLWASLEAGRTGLSTLPLALVEDAPAIRFRKAGQIAELDLCTLTSAQLAAGERCSYLAILAARQAAAQSALLPHHDPAQIAVFLGCSTNGRSAEEPEIARVYTQNARVHPLTIPRAMASNGTSQVAIDLGITGPALTVSTACASGAHAIGLAFQMIRSGMITAALAGAHEAPLTRAFLRAWDSMRVVSPTSCRPFSADRDGMTLAEGAAVLALETLEAARARNAPILAEVLGFGMSADAHHITQPRPEGAAQAITACLRDSLSSFADGGGSASALTDRLAYINAHGTGTAANDTTEARALALALGPAAAARTPLSGTKGFHGHALGASSAIETLITALVLHHRRAPFTAGITMLDPALPLDLILDQPRVLASKGPLLALTTALAFGGLNAVLLLGSAPDS